MKEMTVDQLRAALIHVAARIVQAEARLTELDCIIGDGDHGTGMKTGFSALAETLAVDDSDNFYDLLRISGITLIRVMGGASGVIFGTLFIGGLEQVKGKDVLIAEDLIAYFEQGFYGIIKRGKSCLGSKTMLDALYPAVEGMKARFAETDALEAILEAGWQGALQGVENTKDMLSVTGRSRNFRQKSLGVPDPGAVSVSIVFQGLSEWANRQ